ncbi:uncharacterized protein BROUX77_004893 [Berkeleyomyces rouxiae]|uniref:uncharacterized protein n=1 Tax=Berkeleyomyces rouxiae TaxID=2035830 RepID=UPI003B82877F
MLSRSMSFFIPLLLLYIHISSAHVVRRQENAANTISPYSIVESATSDLTFTPTATATDSSDSFTITPYATITPVPSFNATNSTSAFGRNSTATRASATSTATSEPVPDLPIKVSLTPGLGLAGALLILTGGVLAFWKNNSIQAFLGGTLLAALATIVLIIYVMHPPISKGLQFAYLVAAALTGVALGGMSVLFREILESLACMLGGFCISMWFLSLADDGLIHVTVGRVALIASSSLVGWAIYWIPFTRDWVLMGLMAFAGSTAMVLGVDCFSRAGLKEFWVYLWDIHPDLFEHDMEFKITKGIKAELAAIIILFVAGVVAQLHLWRKIYARKNARKVKEKAARADVEALNEAAGRAIQTKLAQEKASWERIYSDANSIHETDEQEKPTSERNSEDSGVHGMVIVEHRVEEDYTGRVAKRMSSASRQPQPTIAEDGPFTAYQPAVRHVASRVTMSPRSPSFNVVSRQGSLHLPLKENRSSASTTINESSPVASCHASVHSQMPSTDGSESAKKSVASSPITASPRNSPEELGRTSEDNSSVVSELREGENMSVGATVDDAQSQRSIAASQDKTGHPESTGTGQSLQDDGEDDESVSSHASTDPSTPRIVLPSRLSRTDLKTRTNDWVRHSIGADHPQAGEIGDQAEEASDTAEEAARPVNIQDLQLTAADVSIPTTGVSETLNDFYGPSIMATAATREQRRTSRNSSALHSTSSHRQSKGGASPTSNGPRTLLGKRDEYLRSKTQLTQVPNAKISRSHSDKKVLSRHLSARDVNAVGGMSDIKRNNSTALSNLIIPSTSQASLNSQNRAILSPEQRASRLASFRESIQADPRVQTSLSAAHLGAGPSSPALSPGLKPSSSLASVNNNLRYRPEDEEILQRQRSLLLNKMETDRAARETQLRDREVADQRLEQMMNFGGMQGTHRQVLRRMQDKVQ